LSHIPQRKERDCLNCGSFVQGRYCHMCGQENVVPKETFWHMVIHFFYDITHFDSKFFESIKFLVFKPGFLSRQYMLGRRASYLHPVKMYVFTSAIFFLLFFSLFKPSTNFTDVNKELTPKQRADYINSLQKRLLKDSSNVELKENIRKASDTTIPLTAGNLVEMEDGGAVISFVKTKHRTVAEYDSAQKKLPPSQRDGWTLRRLIKKQIALNAEFKEDPKSAGEKLANKVLHQLPYMLFISLPLFALILKLVYLRRKQFYFADHGIFTIHLYVFTFLLLLLVFTLSQLSKYTGLGFLGVVSGILVVALFFYLYKAMRNFYGQRRGKTILKFIIVAISSLLMMLVLLVIFFFFSAITL
jgi:hypothetical protein